MGEGTKNYRTLVVGGGIGIGIVAGTIISNNIGVDSRIVRTLIGAAAAVVITLVVLGLIGLVTRGKKG